jgi:hypothetical protein
MQPLLVVRALGWSCIGFAVGSAVAPRFLAHAMGHGDRVALVRLLGARDLVIGAGLAAAADPAPWLRARLASEVGDAVLHAAGAATGAFRPGRALAITAGAVALGVCDYALLRSQEGRG